MTPVKKSKKKVPAKRKKAVARPKKKSAKKAAKPKAKAKPKTKSKPKGKPKQPKPLPPPAVEGTLLGRVEDFFAHINVIALTLKSPLRVGNSIHIKGHTTDLIEPVASIQIEHQSVQTANKGDAIGIKIVGVARKRDWVFRVD